MIPVTLDTVPYLVAPDTFLIPTFAAEPSGAYFGAHSLVIRGSEPVIVDTGCSLVHDQWLAQTFSVVTFYVRWGPPCRTTDHDHIGNLDVVWEMCPKVTLVCNFPIVARPHGRHQTALEGVRWVDPGQTLDVGDSSTSDRSPAAVGLAGDAWTLRSDQQASS